jgi:hypothetical protein
MSILAIKIENEDGNKKINEKDFENLSAYLKRKQN